MIHVCTSGEPSCASAQLCAGCYAERLLSARRQAAVLGQCWAERIGLNHEELRAQPAWPEHGEKTIRIARRLVSRLTQDPRMIDELARACTDGAARWWERRPERYRVSRSGNDESGS